MLFFDSLNALAAAADRDALRTGDRVLLPARIADDPGTRDACRCLMDRLNGFGIEFRVADDRASRIRVVSEYELGGEGGRYVHPG